MQIEPFQTVLLFGVYRLRFTAVKQSIKNSYLDYLEYCCCIGAGATNFSFSSLDRFQNRLGSKVREMPYFVTLQPLPYIRMPIVISDERFIFCTTSSDLYSSDSHCYVHKVESSSFSSYSICMKNVLVSFSNNFMGHTPAWMLS